MSDPIGYIYTDPKTERQTVFAPRDITIVYAASPGHKHDMVHEGDICLHPGCELTYDEYRAQVQAEGDKG